MYNVNSFFALLDEFAPMSIERTLLNCGEYDNSGIIVKSHEEVSKVLFSLDLSEAAVRRAKRIGADTVVTHHPAIYHPIKSLSEDDKETSALLLAAKFSINVISMHLNLDYAEDGIDANLCKGLGGKEYKILNLIDGKHGYGREFKVENKTFGEFIKAAKINFGSKIVAYGKLGEKIDKAASFCGGGSGYALSAIKEGATDADAIITSDAPHHVIKEIIEYGKKLVLIPHYAAEEFGFAEFYRKIKEKSKKAEILYFCDKRFK